MATLSFVRSWGRDIHRVQPNWERSPFLSPRLNDGLKLISAGRSQRQARGIFQSALDQLTASGGDELNLKQLTIKLSPATGDGPNRLTVTRRLETDSTVLDVVWHDIDAPMIATWRPGPWCRTIFH